MTQRSIHRSLDAVIDDIRAVEKALVRPEQVGAGDKFWRHNHKELNNRLSQLKAEANRYDPVTGLYRGRRHMIGVPRC